MNVQRRSLESHQQSSGFWGANYYDRLFARNMDQFDIRRRRRVFVSMAAALGRVGSAFEVGCGTGDNIAACDADVRAGIDVAPGMVAGARERHPGIDFTEMDVRDLQPRAEHDLVICLGVIQYFDDEEMLLDRLAGLVRPGGHLIVSAPNASSWFRQRYYRRLLAGGHRPFQRDLEIGPLVDALARRGFIEQDHVYHSYALPSVSRGWSPVNMACNTLVGLAMACPVSRQLRDSLAYSYVGLFRKSDAERHSPPSAT